MRLLRIGTDRPKTGIVIPEEDRRRKKIAHAFSRQTSSFIPELDSIDPNSAVGRFLRASLANDRTKPCAQRIVEEIIGMQEAIGYEDLQEIMRRITEITGDSDLSGRLLHAVANTANASSIRLKAEANLLSAIAFRVCPADGRPELEKVYADLLLTDPTVIDVPNQCEERAIIVAPKEPVRKPRPAEDVREEMASDSTLHISQNLFSGLQDALRWLTGLTKQITQTGQMMGEEHPEKGRLDRLREIVESISSEIRKHIEGPKQD